MSKAIIRGEFTNTLIRKPELKKNLSKCLTENLETKQNDRISLRKKVE